MKLYPAKLTFKPLQEAVDRLVARLYEDDNGCWVFTGYTDEDGYGQIKICGRAYWVHRVMYAVATGKVPNRRHVHHTCHNPSCCNPLHLKAMWPKHHNKLSALYQWYGDRVEKSPVGGRRKAG